MSSDPPICLHVSEECPVEYTIYGYRPSLWVNSLLAALFGIAAIIHVVLGIRFRTRSYAIALTLGSFNSAAIYLMFKHLTALFGPEWSLLKPKQYTLVFISADVISLVLQAAGGGIAATAGPDNEDTLDMGNNIMMAGISFQVVTLSIFALLALLYLVRRLRAAHSTPLAGIALQTWQSARFRWFLFGLTTAFVGIYIRCVYRIAEMRGGWGNKLMKEEITFIILEGIMILIATLAQTIFHPGYFFPSLTDKGLLIDDEAVSCTELPLRNKGSSRV
ncbi:hypothetical protein NM208_g3269 [Fusarium decemcellulare]|uniref:Uncharacterized protein n=1 Tax=Fusarium decemcellulare TaxID=57161 RepID=A0ACC1SPV7_9HYPO|nr:hypothetical protein NM208_g3269 [Fusarium decemcellulare]